MPLKDEQQLIVEVQEGSQEAFRELVERYMKQAYNLAYGFLKNHDDAEDITQEAFVKVHASIRTFRGDSGFSTWLHRIVSNLAMTRLKKQKTQSRREVELSHPDAGKASHSESHELMDRKYHIERVLHELPTIQRAVVMLRHMEGFSTKEVGKMLNCSQGTVKTHLHRGLKKMRQRLEFLSEEVAL